MHIFRCADDKQKIRFGRLMGIEGVRKCLLPHHAAWSTALGNAVSQTVGRGSCHQKVSVCLRLKKELITGSRKTNNWNFTCHKQPHSFRETYLKLKKNNEKIKLEPCVGTRKSSAKKGAGIEFRSNCRRKGGVFAYKTGSQARKVKAKEIRRSRSQLAEAGHIVGIKVLTSQRLMLYSRRISQGF